MAPDPAADDSRAGLLGCGLPAWELGAIFALAVVTFLFWGGALWAAPTGASHIGRIVVSYVMVVPLVALALALEKRFRVVHLMSAVALVWSVKLVVTASLYALLASGSASQYSPQSFKDVRAPSGGDTGYQPAATPGALADVSGVVREHGAPVADAVVVVEVPPPGLPLAAPAEVRVTIHGDRYAQPIYHAAANDHLVAVSQDAQLHTLRVERDGRAIRNVPVPPGGAASSVAHLPAGVYQLSCENHPSERATLVVVDHPYATVTDAAGRFTLHGVPAGAGRLEIIRAARAPAHRALAIAGTHTEVSIDLSEGE